jgi:lysophospholipid acyltransferase (LPLAT)-like uncharacterized protein
MPLGQASAPIDCDSGQPPDAGTSQAALSPLQRGKAALVAAILYPAIAALCASMRWRVEGAHHWAEVVGAGRQPILALWHGRILAGLHYFRQRGVVVITSQNFDGEWIARILRRFGFGTARGSTSRGGARALAQLRRDLRAGRPAAFTLDGPRGPARVAQPGAVWLAGATGNPILPFHIEADRFWTLNSWDRTQIPKPFATVAIAIGEPMPVAGTDEATVANACAALEACLQHLESRARELLRD